MVASKEGKDRAAPGELAKREVRIQIPTHVEIRQLGAQPVELQYFIYSSPVLAPFARQPDPSNLVSLQDPDGSYCFETPPRST